MIFGKYAAIGGGIAVVLLWPLAVGQIGQSAYENELKKIDEPDMELSNVSYNRGYLSSDAVTRITFKNALRQSLEEEGLPSTYQINHTITHGIAGVESVSVLDMQPELKELAKTLWGSEESPVVIKQQTSITGATDFNFTVNGLNAVEDGYKVVSKPFILTGHQDKDAKTHFSYSLSSLNVIADDNQSFDVNGLKGEGQGFMDQGVWVGTQRFDLSMVELKGDVDESFTLKDLSINISNELDMLAAKEGQDKDVQPKTITTNNIFKLGEFYTPSTEFTLQNVELGVGAESLDRDSVIQLYKLSNAMTGEPSERELAAIIQAVDEMVEKGVKFSLSPVKADLPQGKTSFDLTLNVDPGINKVSQNVQLLVDKIHGGLSASIPTVLIRAEPSLNYFVSELSNMGFVEEKGTNTEITATLKGEVLVSPTGQEFPLMYLSQLFM
ncbi:DUF945 family protein [Veronia pacifica]|uniref:DUF945 domain-containing protein n=1 Tax=Veronia pacifica TaxID=1080227 RepID=A0A1C3EPM4_9GAMM|nr:DUF945 family protein [Veronia pacifica]ODA35197.1 hypothetical protein A8L45_04600 [Veronia pacifica]